MVPFTLLYLLSQSLTTTHASSSTTTTTTSSTDCSSGTMTNDKGPSDGANQPCVFPFTFQKKQYSSCKSFDVPSTEWPFQSSGTATPQPTDFWCATVAQYGGNDASNPNRKKWGFCDCGASTSITSVPTTITTTTTTTAPYYTDGGLVPQNTACQFPLRKGTTSYHACIPMSDPPRTPSGVNPTPPQWSNSKTWCYAGSTVASTGNAVNYNTLSDTEKSLWGYCVDSSVQQQSHAPTTASIPTASTTTKPPSVWIPGPPTFKTSGGYEVEGTLCTFPFTIKATGKVFTTCAPYLPNTKNGPWVSDINPPAKPTYPTTNTTWCFTGTGKYDKAQKDKNAPNARNLWGFCHEWAPQPPSSSPTSQIPTTKPTPTVVTGTPTSVVTGVPTISTGKPTTTTNTNKPSSEPTVTTKKPTMAPSKKGDTANPTKLPTTATPTTATPTFSPSISGTRPTIPIATGVPSIPSGNSTAMPTASPIGNGTNGSSLAPTPHKNSGNMLGANSMMMMMMYSGVVIIVGSFW
jgi:hypothetical protein